MKKPQPFHRYDDSQNSFVKFLHNPATFLVIGAISITVISLLVLSSFSVGLLSLAALGLISGVGIYFTKKSGPQNLKWLAGGTMILAIFALTNAPVRLAFAMFSRNFDALAAELETDRQPAFPVWIGPFKVNDGGVKAGSGVPYLITSGGHHEINGFAKDTQGKGFNLWSITRLDDRWAYIEED